MSAGPDLSSLSHAQKDALIAALMAQVASLTARVAELEAKLGLPPKTPDNSSVPPSKGQKPSESSKGFRLAERMLTSAPSLISPRRMGAALTYAARLRLEEGSLSIITGAGKWVEMTVPAGSGGGRAALCLQRPARWRRRA